MPQGSIDWNGSTEKSQFEGSLKIAVSLLLQ